MKTIHLEKVSPSDIQNLLNVNLENAKKKNQKKFLVSDIIASENVAIIISEKKRILIIDSQ